jgi:hypothetical protein
MSSGKAWASTEVAARIEQLRKQALPPVSVESVLSWFVSADDGSRDELWERARLRLREEPSDSSDALVTSLRRFAARATQLREMQPPKEWIAGFYENEYVPRVDTIRKSLRTLAPALRFIRQHLQVHPDNQKVTALLAAMEEVDAIFGWKAKKSIDIFQAGKLHWQWCAGMLAQDIRDVWRAVGIRNLGPDAQQLIRPLRCALSVVDGRDFDQPRISQALRRSKSPVKSERPDKLN